MDNRMPINKTSHVVGTVAYWRSVAPHYGCRTWKTAMDRFAVQHGKAIAILCDDSARIVERGAMTSRGEYRLGRWTFAANEVRWHSN